MKKIIFIIVCFTSFSIVAKPRQSKRRAAIMACKNELKINQNKKLYRECLKAIKKNP